MGSQVQAPPTPTQEAQQTSQQNHQASVQAGLTHVGNGVYLTPDQLQSYQNYFQSQANQMFPQNPVFGNSQFAVNHPRAAQAISNILLAGSQARAGMTIGDSIGVASRMSLAPSEYQQQAARERAQFANQQFGNVLNQQKSLADINEANARSNYYGADADYLSGAKTDQANATAEAARQNAATRAQSEADRVANWTANRLQRSNEFTQSDNTKRYVTQFRAMHPTDQVNQAAITQRNFQSHMAMLDQQEARDLSRPNPLTGAPLTPEDKQAIHENYEQERQNETDAYGYIHQQQQDAMGSSGRSTKPSSSSVPGGHKVGDTIYQNGKPFKVTSVDANGKVTGAQ